jgi:hypothetical protein
MVKEIVPRRRMVPGRVLVPGERSVRDLARGTGSPPGIPDGNPPYLGGVKKGGEFRVPGG